MTHDVLVALIKAPKDQRTSGHLARKTRYDSETVCFAVDDLISYGLVERGAGERLEVRSPCLHERFEEVEEDGTDPASVVIDAAPFSVTVVVTFDRGTARRRTT